MKILPVSLFLILSGFLSFHVQAEIELHYKTAEGSLLISGLENKKPFHLSNGKKRFLSPNAGVFEIKGSVEEIIDHAYFPLQFFREQYVPKTEDELDSKLKQGSLKYNHHVTYGGVERRFSFGKIGLSNPLFSAFDSIWGTQLPENYLLVFGWHERGEETHSVGKLNVLNSQALRILAKGGTNIRDGIVSKKDLIPFVLILSEDGTFIPLTENEPNDEWKSIFSLLLSDDADKVSELVERSPAILTKHFSGGSPIHWASILHSESCLQEMVQLGGNPNEEGRDGLRALHLVSGLGFNRSVEFLLESNSKINVTDTEKNTAAHYAAYCGHLGVAKLLVQNRAKLNQKNQKNEPPIFLAAKNDQSQMVQFLEGSGVRFKFSQSNLPIFLLRAIGRNELDSVDYYLSKGAKADQKIFGTYPIFHAARYSSGEIIRLLVKNGANVNRTNRKGVTPLILASSRNLDAVVALIELGADVNVFTKSGATALHIAVLKHQIDITQHLLDHGADPNVRNPNETSLMWLATQVGNRIGLNELISAGAVCNMDPNIAIPMMEYAFQNDIPEIVEITLDQCLKGDFKFYGDIPAYWVAEYYQSETIKELLVQHGADVETLEAPDFVDPKGIKNEIVLVRRQEVPYPRSLAEKYGEFTAKVMVVVDVDGSVILPKIIKSPASEMNRSILSAIKGWGFNPIVIDGESVRTKLVIPWRFIPGPANQERVYEVEAIQFRPKPIHQVAPKYPNRYKGEKVNGVVTVVFVVDTDGSVIHPRVEKSSHPGFEEPAINAIKQWKFSPGFKDGEKVKVRVRAPLVFNVH